MQVKTVVFSHRSFDSGEDSVKICRNNSSILLESQLNEKETNEYNNLLRHIRIGM